MKTMLSRTLHWNSLVFFSNYILNESEYIHSNQIGHQEIDPETSFEQMEEFVSPFLMPCKEILMWQKTGQHQCYHF